jgi:hypothetical protein
MSNSIETKTDLTTDNTILMTSQGEISSKHPISHTKKNKGNFWKSKRVEYTEENSDNIRIEFDIILSGTDKAETKANGYYNTRVAKGMSHSEIESTINRALTRRFSNSSIFPSTSIKHTYKIIEEDSTE